MKVTSSTVSVEQLDADALVVLVFEESRSAEATQVNKLTGGLLDKLAAEGELSAKLGKLSSIHLPPGLKTKLLVVAGGGAQSDFGAAEAMRVAGAAAKRLADKARSRVAFAIDGAEPIVALAVSAAIGGFVGQDLLRSEKNFKAPDELVWLSSQSAGVKRGEIIGESLLLVRRLVNLPPNLLTPTSFTQEARQVCEQNGIELEVWDEVRLRREGCGALLGVAAGSQTPPRLLIMKYPGQRTTAPVALVGKGVTFDSGGLSIKPTDGMLTMKCDMAGAATVLGTLVTAARLELPQPIVGLVGLVENMISGNSLKLGDVLTARSGTTIEVHNTDAEGRLVLADVLNVALDHNPECIIDLATLTGACVVALGVDIAGLMTNNEKLQTDFQQAAARAGELVWPLPMHKFFDEQISSQVADIKNMGDGRWGGAITAAKFLERFIDSKPWLHIDIAGPAFADKPKPHQDAGGTGCMLRSLIEFLTNFR